MSFKKKREEAQAKKPKKQLTGLEFEPMWCSPCANGGCVNNVVSLASCPCCQGNHGGDGKA